MVKLPHHSGQEYYMDGYLKQNLDIARKVIKKDWDMVFLVDGTEGGGKSTIGQQGAYYCDETFNIEDIAFTAKQFESKVLGASQYKSIVYDEAYQGLSARDTMSNINKALIKMLAEIRQKNLFIFIIMPTFFDLDRYAAIWRSRALIHIYTGDNFERGYFGFYNSDKKKMLYIQGKKFYDYRQPSPNFIGRFTSFYTVDEKEYRKRKLESLHHKTDEAEDKKGEEQSFTEQLFLYLQNPEFKFTHLERMNILRMPESTYYWHYKKYKKNTNELLGN
jgi:hypothetical protein